MRVKVGDKVYDSKDVPIMFIMSDRDKENISRMDPYAHQYAEFESVAGEGGWTQDEMRQWMAEDG